MSNKNVINLNRARKSRARTEKAARGAENAVKFGRTKDQRVLERRLDGKDKTQLDGHKIGDAPETPNT
ncbi:DUF4169 family protein [Thalassobacter stenotrophicus]|uniref:Uncharacterized protein n=2 Tax=Thalassobacter stenotrophicus TaxID=266809 RepID=A0A0P1EWC2_9RHOB|nr:DUF4169 family protein [Thalassobacter stenotrophicus]CUH59115.1 hypothetical protein THS5294_00397 [Thalassobacter stenotrophicus]SHJ04732.1 protein of unknown function [Thalassobacter stenotrophicus DSM 16310]